MKKTIIIDFDGVMHAYTSGWRGATVIPDGPVEGTREAMQELRKKFRVVVLSTRCHQEGGIEAIKSWLYKHCIDVDDVVRDKEAAVAMVDDRAIRFEGDWPTVVRKLYGDIEPWTKRNFVYASRGVEDLARAIIQNVGEPSESVGAVECAKNIIERIRTIDIVFSGEGPNMQFVEVETPEGVSLRIGEWHTDEKGFHRLRFQVVSPKNG